MKASNDLINRIIHNETDPLTDHKCLREMGCFCCVLCGGYFKGFGNNPAPLADGSKYRCCERCNVVIVFKFRLLGGGRDGDRRLFYTEENGARIYTEDACSWVPTENRGGQASTSA